MRLDIFFKVPREKLDEIEGRQGVSNWYDVEQAVRAELRPDAVQVAVKKMAGPSNFNKCNVMEMPAVGGYALKYDGSEISKSEVVDLIESRGFEVAKC